MIGNQIPLTINTLFDQGQIKLQADCFEIDLEVQGRDDFSGISNTFALWICLPIAMSLNRDLHILGQVSPTALSNAKKLIEIWFAWRPDLFHIIKVSAEHPTETAYAHQQGEIMLYSGGADSTYALLTHYLHKGTQVAALTIQGMDYDADDTVRFNALLAKTRPLRDLAINEHYIVRSNAAEIMARYGTHGDCGHGFQLFGSLFLLEDRYRSGSIAADCTRQIEMLICPWGTSSLTNPLFASSQFHINTLDIDLGRPEKLAALSTNEMALQCVSFCKKRKIRPDNCGVCSKCSRSKAMFLAETGRIPDMFLDNSFSEDMLLDIDLSNRGERGSAMDLISSAARNGRLSLFPQLTARLCAKPARQSWLERQKAIWVKRIRQLNAGKPG
ncbi:hypothetical protein [Halopseudomonas pelagia]|uniref:hypothetical protein n=1 Tax=Halopseudomonas pelagia TaxID=553151 RepID=UPI0003A46EF1|nr:hypothetical protein [Halopseudomonas pelagia]|tara:strand:+ start:407 stop:1567 length:1161 start_codon:yes stop_codon:yes gene_type:complete